MVLPSGHFWIQDIFVQVWVCSRIGTYRGIMNLFSFMCEKNRQMSWVLYPFKASCLFKFLAWNVRECNISLFHRTMIWGAVIKVSEFRVLHIHSNINSMQNNEGNMLIQAIITLVLFSFSVWEEKGNSYLSRNTLTFFEYGTCQWSSMLNKPQISVTHNNNNNNNNNNSENVW
jgi:hypothetical protein